MNTKTCTRCKEAKAYMDFKLVLHRGKPYLMAECRECGRDRDRERYAKRMSKAPPPRSVDPLNKLANHWRGRVNRKEPLRWRA